MPRRDLQVAALVALAVTTAHLGIHWGIHWGLDRSSSGGLAGAGGEPAVASALAVDYRHFYRPVAENLLDGAGLVNEAGRPALRYPPGYPLALTLPLGLARLTGGDPDTTVRLWAFALAGITSGLVFLLARRFFSRRWSLLATAVWSAYPLALWMFRQVNSEVLFTPLLLTLLIAFLGARETDRTAAAALVGTLCGALALIRPAAIGLGLILAALWAWQERRGRSAALGGAALILATNLLVLLPWEVAAYRSVGRLVPLSSGGAPSMADGLTFGVRHRGYRAGTWVPTQAREVMREIDARYSPALSSPEVARIFLEAAAERPVGAAQLLALKTTRSWYGTDSQRREGAVLLIQLLFLPPAIAGLVAAWRRGDPALRRAAAVVTALIAYFWLASIASLSIVRYTVPAVALLMTMLPGLGLPGFRRPPTFG